MSKENENKNTRRNKKGSKNKKNKKLSVLRVTLIVLLLVVFISAGTVGGLMFAVVRTAPEISPSHDINTLSEHSKIYDEEGTLIEEILTEQTRTVINLEDMSEHIPNAFIAIEDERFYDHFGIDPKGILRALVVDIKSGSFEEGASTITQQLVRNMYLTKDKKLTRKIKEMYLAIEMERKMSKDEILEGYLNTIYLGQGSYGVQAAAQTYFSKDAKDLTIAEAALIAGITKNPSKNALYKRVEPDSIKEDNPDIVGSVNVLGKTYVALFNDDIISRQRKILSNMKENGMITEEQYNTATNKDIKELLIPGQKKNKNIDTSYFSDYVKDQVIDDLVDKAGYTEEEAQDALYTGGLKIYTTMDINMQSKIENVYNKFESVMKTVSGNRGLTSKVLDKYGNIIDKYGKIMFYKKQNILDNEGNLVIRKGTYNIDDSGNLIIKNPRIYYLNLSVGDYYSIKNNKLYTHTTWALDLPDESWTPNKEDKSFTIKASYLNEHKSFYKKDSNGNLLISSERFYNNEKGVIQPQSSVVIMDYNTGKIKALVGGRDVEGQRIFNRATDAPRQPGSSMKPLGVYLPALDNGFTAASVIDDIPHYDSKGNLWPDNWYDGYRGLVNLRYSVEQSINVAAVKFLEKIGVNTSMDYLARLGVINTENPSEDTFVTKEEAMERGSGTFDENLSALALGGMTKGITPLTMTGAYGAIANNGVYTEPIAYTKVTNNKGEVILENKPMKNTVVTPQVSYLMTDILKGAVTNGTGRTAQIRRHNSGIPVAGKTGTTQNKADAWFVGYTPYYVSGVWIGNDSPAIKLTNGSKYAAYLWSEIMTQIHEGHKDKGFSRPEGFVTRQICLDSGKLATDLCRRDPRGSRVRSEIFIKGTEPTQKDDTHVQVAYDTSTGMLVNDYCPSEYRSFGVFIQRPVPYNPAEHNGIVPWDYKYTVPKKVCDVHTKPEPKFGDWLNDFLFDDDKKDKDKDKDKHKHKDENKNNDESNNSDDVIDSNDD